MTIQTVVGLSTIEGVQINKPVMLGHAARSAFAEEINRPTHDFETVEDRHFGVLRALLVAMMFDGKVSGETLNMRVQIQNDVKESTARKHISEAESMKLITEGKALNDGRESVYRFSPGVQEKLAKYSALELKIIEVVNAQLANPTDPTAGDDLVVSDIYFNVIAPQNRRLANKAITEKRDEKTRKKEQKNAENRPDHSSFGTACDHGANTFDC